MEIKDESKFLRILDEIHNEIYANEGLSRQQAFEEIIKVLFVKMFDEQESLGHFFISKQEKSNCVEKGKSSTFERRMNDLFKFTRLKYKGVFDTGDKIHLKTMSLGLAIEKLGAIHLNKLAVEGAGIVFQKFISNHQKGERGQFFTPEWVVKMCVEIINPGETDKVLDPACGSGGFLTQVLRARNVKNKIRGIEINRSVARVAKMGILLMGGDPQTIIVGDSLATKPEDKMAEGWADVILTNPPFGMKGKIRNKKLLRGYELGHKYVYGEEKWNKTRILLKGQVPEILFIERCLKLLKRNGRMAMIIPQGKLENPRFGYVRKYMKDQAELIGVIDLPKVTFEPYGTSVKTSVVILKKVRRRGGRVFFGKIENTRTDSIEKIVRNYQYFQKRGEIKDNYCFSLKCGDIPDRIDYEFNRPKYKILHRKLKKRGAIELGKLTNISYEAPDEKIKKKNKVKYIEISDISSTYCEINSHRLIGGNILPRRAAYIIRRGDILIAIAGNMIGMKKQAVALVGEEYDGAMCSSGFRVLRNFTIDSYYLLYYIKSKDFRRQIRRYRVGSLIPSVSEEDLAKILVIVPNKKQVEIISQRMRKSINLRKKANKIWRET